MIYHFDASVNETNKDSNIRIYVCNLSQDKALAWGATVLLLVLMKCTRRWAPGRWRLQLEASSWYTPLTCTLYLYIFNCVFKIWFMESHSLSFWFSTLILTFFLLLNLCRKGCWPFWDAVTCWPHAVVGETVHRACPAVFSLFRNSTGDCQITWWKWAIIKLNY